MQHSPSRRPNRPSVARRFYAVLLLFITYLLPQKSSAEMYQRQYDPDSLVYVASDIVEGRLVDREVTITAVHAGGLHAGQRIFVNQLNGYQKGASWFMKGAPLTSSDRLILFLSQDKGSGQFYAIYSSAGIIWRGHVLAFGEWLGGPMTASLGTSNFGSADPTVAEFWESIRQRLRKAEQWRARFAEPLKASDIPEMIALLKERAPLNNWGMFEGYNDVISAEAVRRLEAFHDLPSDEKALTLDNQSSWSLAKSFDSSQGVEYIFSRLSDRRVPLPNRVALAQVLRGQSQFPATRPAADRHVRAVKFLSRLTELATINASDEDVAANLIGAITPATQPAGDFSDVNPSNDYVAALRPLIDLYHKPSTSESLRFRIEQAMYGMGDDIYRQLGSLSGPILSLVQAPDANAALHTLSSIAFRYDLVGIDNEPRITATELVIESVQTGEQKTVAFGNLSLPRGGCSSGSYDAPMPTRLAPGNYRIFFRFKNGSKVLGEGHYLETMLPQQLPATSQQSWIFPPGSNALIPFPRIVKRVLIGIPAIPLLMLVPLAMKARQRRVRFHTGLCIQCGYDLRASSNRCPECAAALPQRLDPDWLKRPLLRATAVGAAITSVAIIAFWIRGYHAADCVSVTTPSASGSIYSTRGNLVVERGGTIAADLLTYEHQEPLGFPRSSDEAGGKTAVHLAGFELSPDANLLVIPCWLATVVSVGTSVAALKRYRWLCSKTFR